MKKLLLSAAGIAMALAVPATAQEGWYAKGGVGYGVYEDATVTANGASGEIDPEGDLRFMAGVGYAYANNWRIDVDIMDRYADGGSIGDNGVSTTDIQNVALMLNGIYDLNRSGQLNPYVGAGIGLSRSDISASGAWNNAAINANTGESNFGWQALAGLGWKLSEQLTADFEYRYFNGGDVSASGVEFADMTSHDFIFGLRYAFAAPAAVAPMVPAPPTTTTAPMAATCDDVDFIVYFEWDRSALTDQAAATIGAAADQADSCDITRVSIEGHADRSGAASYNVRLSERRARVVRDELVRRGVPASLIAIEAKGESEPAVSTNDGAREPLNRRSEVVIRVQ